MNADKSNMASALEEVPKQFAEGFALARHAGFSGVQNVVIAGMGGSSLHADIINELLPALPLVAHRNYGLPDFADENTLVLATSYSGNTEETIDSLREALRRRCKTIVVANAGKLLEIAKREGLQFVQIPQVIQPRCGTGYFFSSTLQVLYNCGLSPDFTRQVSELSLSLLDVNASEAKALAKKLKGRLPVIYASQKFLPAARISKIKFNENSKTQCLYNVFPELNHNEMVGFTKPLAKFHFLLLQDENDEPRVKKRMQVMKKLFEARKMPVTILPLNGKNFLEKTFRATYFFDWVSYYLALEYGIDPAPVEMVEKFKKALE
jgi:glucose/mannose-6-phosphate isomerase